MKKFFLTLFLGLSLIFAPTILAAKVTAIVTLDNPTPHYGDTILATISSNSMVTYPWLECTQNGILVEVSGGFTSGAISYTQSYVLGSPAWLSGGADCTIFVKKATSSGRHDRVVGSLDFVVLP